jgi:hypothetical protein
MHTIFSPALVWKSLRNASDMVVVGSFVFVSWLGLIGLEICRLSVGYVR